MLFLYAQSFTFGIINCDDYEYIKFVVCKNSLFSCSEGIFMPLTWISYKVDFLISEFSSYNPYAIMHFHSALLHGLNSILLFTFLRTLFPRFTSLPLFLGTLFWAVHPLRVESVTWIASRKDVLSMFFFLLSAITWIRFRLEKSKIFYISSLLFFLFALASKPSAMTFPILMILLEILVIREFKFWNERSIILTTVLYSPLLCFSLGAALLATYAQGEGGALIHQASIPFWWKCMNAVSSIGVYIKNTFLPTMLAPQCLIKWPSIPKNFAFGTVTLALTTLSALVIIKKRKVIDYKIFYAGILFFIVSIGPMLGIIGFGIHAYADRFTYIPAIGLTIMISFFIEKFMVKCRSIIIFCIIIISLYTIKQIKYWENDNSLWNRTLEVDGQNNYNALANLALYHFEFTHDLNNATNYFNRAFTANPKKNGYILPYYLLALYELGETNTITDVYFNLSAWNSSEVKRAQQEGISVNNVLGYLIGRIAYLSTKGMHKTLVEKEKKELYSILPENVHVQYLGYLLGDHEAKEVVPVDLYDYVQYRFLRK